MTETQKIDYVTQCFACGASVPHVNAQTWFCDRCQEGSDQALTAEERRGIYRNASVDE